MDKPLDNEATYWQVFAQTHMSHLATHSRMSIYGIHKEFGYALATDAAAKFEVSRGATSLALAKLKKRELVEKEAHRVLLLMEDRHLIVHEIDRNIAVLAALFQNILCTSKDAPMPMSARWNMDSRRMLSTSL